MGLFSTKKTIQVSSVTYNLAGDEKDRPNYLRTTLVGAMRQNGGSIANKLTDSYLHGPGMQLRKFPKWAREQGFANAVGIPRGGLDLPAQVNKDLLVQYLPKKSPSQGIRLQTAEIGSVDYSYWVARYMVENYPLLLDTQYTSDYNFETNTIRIILPDTSTVSFVPDNFDPLARYLYASYTLTADEFVFPVVTGDTYTVPPSTFPSTAGYTNKGTGVWEKIEKLSTLPSGQTRIKVHTLYMSATTYREDTQIINEASWSDLEIFIYKQNSGNPNLDSFFNVIGNLGDFYPYIPIRVNNVNIEPPPSLIGDFYPSVKKATKKSIRADYDNLLKKLNDNPSIGDIDFAYVVFGVSLGTLDDTCRRYVYEFFKEITLGQDLTNQGLNAWRIQWAAAKAQNQLWNDWLAAQQEGVIDNPLTGTPQPATIPYPEIPKTSVRIAGSNSPGFNFDMTITWSGITETIGAGQFQPGAKKGDSRIVGVGVENFEQISYTGNGGSIPYDILPLERIRIWMQDDHDTWRRLDIWGLTHTNMVYAGKGVEVTAMQALDKPEESGFIIPLQEELYKRLNLRDATQMVGACAYLVLNCYTIVKQKWYQTTWFKIILVVIVIVLIIAAPYIGIPTGVGLLGSAASVGAAIGFTGTAAIIAGTIANAVAAMIVSQLITMASTAIFGDKVGAIVGMVASTVAIAAGTGYMNGVDLTTTFTNMLDPVSLLKMTASAGEGYASFMQAQSKESIGKAQEIAADYQSQAKAIAEQMDKEFGSNPIDPAAITDIAKGIINEPPGVFLNRTLMSGSDIADMSVGMISRMSEVTLSTELPT